MLSGPFLGLASHTGAPGHAWPAGRLAGARSHLARGVPAHKPAFADEADQPLPCLPADALARCCFLGILNAASHSWSGIYFVGGGGGGAWGGGALGEVPCHPCRARLMALEVDYLTSAKGTNALSFVAQHILSRVRPDLPWISMMQPTCAANCSTGCSSPPLLDVCEHW